MFCGPIWSANILRAHRFRQVKWHEYGARSENRIRPKLDEDSIRSFDELVDMRDKLLPEIGSKGYEHIQILEVLLSSVDSDKHIKTGIPVLLWNDVQEGIYRYICYHDEGINVKIVISEVLFCHIILKEVL